MTEHVHSAEAAKFHVGNPSFPRIPLTIPQAAFGHMHGVESSNKDLAVDGVIRTMQRTMEGSSGIVLIRDFSTDTTATLRKVDHNVVLLRYPVAYDTGWIDAGMTKVFPDKPVIEAAFDEGKGFSLRIAEGEVDSNPFELHVPQYPPSGFFILFGGARDRCENKYIHTGGIVLQGVVHKKDGQRFDAIEGLIHETDQKREKGILDERGVYYERSLGNGGEYLVYKEIHPKTTEVVEDVSVEIAHPHVLLYRSSEWRFRLR